MGEQKPTPTIRTFFEILWISTRLGLTSFGGPAAHLGYFYNEYIKRRKWLDEKSYADLVALCQFLPGPASSQVGMALGMIRGGLSGGVAAWLGFTLPSVVVLVLFALLIQGTGWVDSGWIQGLKIAAVAVVAHAVLNMGKKLAPDRARATLVIAAAVTMLWWPTSAGQILIIAAAGLFGYVWFRNRISETRETQQHQIELLFSRKAAVTAWVLFFGLLLMLPVLSLWSGSYWLQVFDSFFRTGSLVFGGGHVVLPLLEREVVPTGWVSEKAFLAGYGAAQAIPGPLFTFAAYLGAVMNGWMGALVATIAIFLPSFFLVIGTLPFWEQIRSRPAFQAALQGVNAAVVGILLAALYNPLWTGTIHTSADFALAGVLFAMLSIWKWPSWTVVIAATVGGMLITG
ncbi:MAG: chromate efflux transporter [Bacillaceae bacterium]|nr:chromate efflux transporter [Bacillaceae bacterium]